jgi:flagellar basal body-associated protein FliL
VELKKVKNNVSTAKTKTKDFLNSIIIIIIIIIIIVVIIYIILFFTFLSSQCHQGISEFPPLRPSALCGAAGPGRLS